MANSIKGPLAQTGIWLTRQLYEATLISVKLNIEFSTARKSHLKGYRRTKKRETKHTQDLPDFRRGRWGDGIHHERERKRERGENTLEHTFAISYWTRHQHNPPQSGMCLCLETGDWERGEERGGEVASRGESLCRCEGLCRGQGNEESESRRHERRLCGRLVCAG